MSSNQIVIRPLIKEKNMSILKNPVQAFIRNLVRLVVFVPFWFLIAYRDFTVGFLTTSAGRLLTGGIKTLVIFWVANILAGMFYILPQWERLVLLRLGKSVGT